MLSAQFPTMSSDVPDTIETIAARLVMLQESRPELLKDPVGYKDHMHEEYLLYEEMLRRCGTDNTIEYIAQAKKTMELLNPTGFQLAQNR